MENFYIFIRYKALIFKILIRKIKINNISRKDENFRHLYFYLWIRIIIQKYKLHNQLQKTTNYIYFVIQPVIF